MPISQANSSIKNNAALRKHKGSYFALAEYIEAKDVGYQDLNPKKLSESEKQAIRNEVNRVYRFKQVVIIGTVILLFGGLAYFMF